MHSRIETVSELSSFERSFRAGSVLSPTSPVRSPSVNHNKGKSIQIQRRLYDMGIHGETTGEVTRSSFFHAPDPVSHHKSNLLIENFAREKASFL